MLSTQTGTTLNKTLPWDFERALIDYRGWYFFAGWQNNHAAHWVREKDIYIEITCSLSVNSCNISSKVSQLIFVDFIAAPADIKISLPILFIAWNSGQFLLSGFVEALLIIVWELSNGWDGKIGRNSLVPGQRSNHMSIIYNTNVTIEVI